MLNITLSNVLGFIEGNIKYLYSKIYDLPIHIQEQYYYRLYICKDTCLIKGKCLTCGCPILKKLLNQKPCNPNIHKSLMPKQQWDKYKIDNNINDSIFKEIKKTINEIKKKN